MRSFLLILALVAAPARAATTVTLFHFSDYHSHALPFYTDEGPGMGGIARAIGYLARQKRSGALVFSGGDMMNKGAPAWSDRYRCAEWTWLDGIVDAMALGNHEADYGYEAFIECRDGVRYPILSANTAGFPPSTVLTSKGVRIGVFAVAGPDFPALVRVPELRFSDAVAAAREAVRRLREDEKVDAVVMIGHQHSSEDFALARSVPGIDLIFGTHGHLKQELTQIPDTDTYFISAFQYLAYISRVNMTFDGRKLMRVTGELVPVDQRMRADRRIAAKVATMQHDLEHDPDYRDLFVSFGALDRPLPTAELARRTVELMRRVASADVAVSTASTFRRPLPSGSINAETLRAALPYDNEIVIAELPAERARALLDYARTQRGDALGYVAGEITRSAVIVATTDYVSRVAPGYREFFDGVTVKRSGLRLREELRKQLANGSLPP